MPTPASVSPLVIGIGALAIAWRLSMRIRRAVGWQPLRLWRARLSVVLMPLAMLGLFAATGSQPGNAVAQGLGMVLGFAAATYALRTSSFRVEPAGHYFKPNVYVASTIVAVFAARLIYRFVQIDQAMGGFAAAPATGLKNPLTALLAGLVLSYYGVYSWGLLRWHRRTAAEVTPGAT